MALLGASSLALWPRNSAPVLSAGSAPAGTPDFSDSAQDGTPDFLRLDDPADRQAFRQWFTFLAEAQYFRDSKSLPREISDCAALIRYSYREALRQHDGIWAASLGLRFVPSIPSIAKYHYPDTPAQAGLFRVRTGTFQPADLSDGTFAQFADARTLRRANTHFIGHDLKRAMPGDILFFRQLDQKLPFHTMIFLGASQVDRARGPFLLYHTGPDGEIRRPSVNELLEHPQPQWRPMPGNSNFLGVFRWNILRDGDEQ